MAKTIVTWAQAVRDVLLSAMARGQLPLLGLLALVAMIVAKFPEERLVSLVERLFELWTKGDSLGWAAWAATVLGWIVYARISRKLFQLELDRVAREKSELQKLLNGKSFPSSKK